MEHKRLTIFAGHYGSGKTNIAVNYATLLAGEGKPVCIADMDIVNPYFRTADSRVRLEQAGVQLIAPPVCKLQCGSARAAGGDLSAGAGPQHLRCCGCGRRRPGRLRAGSICALY